MSKISEAVDAIQQYAERNRAIILVADLLSELGSVEQATLEASARRDAAIARLNETTVALEDASGKLGEVRADADRSLSAAQKQSSDMVEEARKQADDIVTRGREDAANLLLVAQKDTIDQLAAANGHLDALTTKIGEARKELENTNAATSEAIAKLNETNAAITSMKESAQKVLSE